MKKITIHSDNIPSRVGNFMKSFPIGSWIDAREDLVINKKGSLGLILEYETEFRESTHTYGTSSRANCYFARVLLQGEEHPRSMFLHSHTITFGFLNGAGRCPVGGWVWRFRHLGKRNYIHA